MADEYLKCIKSLYKSTYKRLAFNKNNKKYKVLEKDWIGLNGKKYLFVEDNLNQSFSFSMIPDEIHYYMFDYFKQER